LQLWRNNVDIIELLLLLLTVRPMIKWAKSVVDRLTTRAITEQLDRRRLQAEIDTHRLFLLTAFYERRVATGGPTAEALDEEAQALGFEVGRWCTIQSITDHSQRPLTIVSIRDPCHNIN
jgi:hypothetical protein